MKLDVYGKQLLEVQRRDGRWRAFIVGDEGKKRDAGISIPDGLNEAELIIFVADIYHEWASLDADSVLRVD